MSLENKALHRAEILLRLIRENGYKEIAEIGIREGETTRIIVQKGEIESYLAVDRNIDKILMSWIIEGRKPVNYIIMDSIEAAQMVPNESLDLVFIDADHDHRSVVNDIKAWLPKIRKGGMITGHDYCQRRYSGVVNAVSEMFTSVEKELDDFDVYVWYKKI